jgi:acyl carrier protein
VAQINEAFSIELTPLDLEPENFDSVDALLTLIKSKEA